MSSIRIECHLETKMITKFARTTLSTLSLALGVAASAHADEVHVAGSTLGRFNLSAYAAVSNLNGLTYDNSSFDNTTVGGMLDLGGNPIPGANVNNLGSFTLDNTDQLYAGNTFDLLINFTVPGGIAGGSSSTYTDKLYGTVKNGLGGVFIDFNNTPQTFTFNNGVSAGAFTVFVNDLSIAPGKSSSLTGHITGEQQAVPEPASIAALVIGGIGFLRRRKQSK